jgi:hypothetical protein
MPIDGLAKIVLQLVEQREQVKQTIYEVTGISDIVRGASKADETATAQQIKGRWAGCASRPGRRSSPISRAT